ncbi:MAG: phosphatase PAP2 family protein [Chloroflexi bacterium]|nr:phosphatase PAP2 family protein [Chloroflexota bacterium]
MTVRSIPMARPCREHSAPLHLRCHFAWLPAFGRDWAILLAVIGAYFLARGIAPTRIQESVWITVRIVDLEKAARIFWEPDIQAWSIRWHAVQEVANFIYAYLHFPVLAAVGLWAWWRGRERFLFLRNVMFISMVFGLAFYYAFPAAPPRLIGAYGYDLGFTDTVFGGNTSVSYAQPALILNEYAAIPSFHFGWIAMAAAAIWVNTASRTLRAIGLVLTVLMTWAIVASANHFFLDMALGGAIVWLSWKIARRLEARHAAARSTAADDDEALAVAA